MLQGEVRQGKGHHGAGLPSLSLGMIHPAVCMEGSSVPGALCSAQRLELLLPGASVPPSCEITGLRKPSTSPSLPQATLLWQSMGIKHCHSSNSPSFHCKYPCPLLDPKKMQFEKTNSAPNPPYNGVGWFRGALAGCNPKQVLALKASCFSMMVVVFKAAVQVLDHLLVIVWEPGCEFGSIHVHAARLRPETAAGQGLIVSSPGV